MSERRKIFGEKFVDLGNFTVVGLVFSQIVGAEKSLLIIISGIVFTVVFWLVGFTLLKTERRKK